MRTSPKINKLTTNAASTTPHPMIPVIDFDN